ncbi:isoprenyl transferase [Clostridium sediminicola]|uniref:isoprenyl transferase n=1 Tax=Clostridium sediminicola TaxID=3114879 RepID=UPI0031F2236C
MVLFRKRRKTKDNSLININREAIPKHIAIIMDGNGRWAKAKGMPRVAGHKAGAENVRRIVKECNKLGIEFLTLYTFSTENWKRPKDEVNALMKLLVDYLKNEFQELHENNVVIKSIGDINELPEECVRELNNSYQKTKNNTGLTLNLALNYGGRSEIVNAVKRIMEHAETTKINSWEVNEMIISDHLYTRGIVDPEIIIRTGGEQRISNFLLWQCAYSEFWYTDKKWPDFDEAELHKAIYDFQNRDRRYGGLK